MITLVPLRDPICPLAGRFVRLTFPSPALADRAAPTAVPLVPTPVPLVQITAPHMYRSRNTSSAHLSPHSDDDDTSPPTRLPATAHASDATGDRSLLSASRSIASATRSPAPGRRSIPSATATDAHGSRSHCTRPSPQDISQGNHYACVQNAVLAALLRVKRFVTDNLTQLLSGVDPTAALKRLDDVDLSAICPTSQRTDFGASRPNATTCSNTSRCCDRKTRRPSAEVT